MNHCGACWDLNEDQIEGEPYKYCDECLTAISDGRRLFGF